MAINTGCLYGATDNWKTTNLGWLAKHIYKKTKKPIRWVTADAGGYRPVMPFVEAGIIQPLNLINDPQRLLVLAKLVEGYWPRDIENGTRTSKVFLKPDTLKDVGGYIFEGITSLSEAIHTIYVGKETGMKAAYNEKINSDFVVENENGSNSVISGTVVGGYSMDSYGVVQGHMMRSINYSWTLPVEYVWWSGHDLLTEDEADVGSGRKVITGVALTGRAATPRLGKHLGTVIHAYKTLIEGGKLETRYYFQSHPDNNSQIKAIWEAKARVPGSAMKELLDTFKGGYFIPSFNDGLDRYIEKEEELLAKSNEDVKKWKGEIDGTK